MRHVNVNGTVFQVDDAGHGSVLIFLHSGVSDRRMWDPQFGRLAQTHRVIRWDHRGYRDTPYGDGSFSYAEDIVALMDALRIPTATLVGASIGGMMAIRVALEHPRRVERLVLVGTNLYGYEPSPGADAPAELVAAYERAEAAHNVEAMIDVDMQFWIAGLRRRPSDLDPAFIELSRDMLRSGYQQPPTGEPLDDATSDVERLGQLVIPTLVVVGDEDIPTIQAIGRLIAETAPSVEFATIAQAAHAPSLEKAGWFNNLLTQWLEGTATT